MNVDLPALSAVGSAIAFPLVGDRERTDEIVAESLEWLATRPEAAAAPVPFLASHVVAVAAAAHGRVGRTRGSQRSAIAAALRANSVSARTAFALAVLCGYDVPTTASLCQRTEAQVRELLEPLTSTAETARDLLAHDAAESSGARPVATGSVDESPTRRRCRPRGGSVAVVAIVAVAVIGVTYPGGARPSFASSVAPTSCNAGNGPGTVSSITVGPEHRYARLFRPTGTGIPEGVVVLIGDGSETPDAAVAQTGLESAAGIEDFVLLTLSPPAGGWNLGATPGESDDLTYASSAIAAAQATNCVDGSQLSIVGYGTGAILAAELACGAEVHPDRLAMIRGTYFPPSCSPEQAISVLMDVDSTDDVLPETGGWGAGATAKGGVTPSSLDAADAGWSRLEGCTGGTSGEAESSGEVITTRQGCTRGTTVTSQVSSGQGHAWPAEATGAVVRLVSGS